MDAWFAVFAGLVVVGAIAIYLFQSARPAFESKVLPGDDARCVACNSEEILREGEGLYRCRACGYEGGEGRAALEQQRRRDSWRGRPWPERRDAAAQDLEDARLLLLAAQGEVRVLARYLDDDETLKEIDSVWKTLALSSLEVLTDEDFMSDGPGDLQQLARDRLMMENNRAWALLCAAQEKVAELEVGAAPAAEYVDLQRVALIGGALKAVIFDFRGVAAQVVRERKRLEVLDSPGRT